MFLESKEEHLAGMRALMILSALWVAKELLLDAIKQKGSIRYRNSSEGML